MPYFLKNEKLEMTIFYKSESLLGTGVASAIDEGTLGAGLLENSLSGKGMLLAGYGNKEGKELLRAGHGSKKKKKKWFHLIL